MPEKEVRILSISDQVVDRMYSPHVKTMFSDVDLILSCGDLPYYYLEYLLDMLSVPMFFVHGNHDPEVEIGAHGDKSYPLGAKNIHGRVVEYRGIIILGFEGSIRYSNANRQYTQSQVWFQVIKKIPSLLWRRIKSGRYLDILVTHSPAQGLGDGEDPAHIGFKAYRWLIKVFKPRYHLHGHVHIYDRNKQQHHQFYDTTIVNVCNFQRLDFLYVGDQNE
jgi:Icc-related predicted phosphoesterase